jgi:hypothetical protein
MSMDWANERYIRLYTRDTPEWLCLSFPAQGLLALLMRKVSRAGILELGRLGRRGVFVVIGHAHQGEMLEPALDELLADGCVQINGTTLVIPNFLEAQETPASDAQRAREHRARIRDGVTQRKQNVTEPTATPTPRDAGVTERDAGVTECNKTVTPNCAVPSVLSDPLPRRERPDRPARVGVGHPAFLSVQHWRDSVWPAMSPAPCPAVTERELPTLGRLVATHGIDTVNAAMDRAAADKFWRDKLTLGVFAENFARFLPRHGEGGPPAKRRTCIGSDGNGQPIYAEEA